MLAIYNRTKLTPMFHTTSILLRNNFRTQLLMKTKKIPLLPKPGSTKFFDWSKIVVREATSEDASTIAMWVQNRQEVRWLGADKEDLDESTVRRWIEESWGAFVLYEIAETGTPGQPVAFANVAPLDADPTEFRIEVGRLLVKPKHRRQGLGSTLVRHLSVAISKTIEEVFPNTTSCEINFRVMRGNKKALGLIENLPFSNTTSLPSSADPRYHWFKYLLDNQVRPVLSDEILQLWMVNYDR